MLQAHFIHLCCEQIGSLDSSAQLVNSLGFLEAIIRSLNEENKTSLQTADNNSGYCRILAISVSSRHKSIRILERSRSAIRN